MDYRDKCNAEHLLEMLVSRDAEILDEMLTDYACINTLIEAIWNHGMYEVMTQCLQSRDEKKQDDMPGANADRREIGQIEDLPGFEGTTDALEALSHCYKTGNDL